jgi:hypothetical protein
VVIDPTKPYTSAGLGPWSPAAKEGDLGKGSRCRRRLPRRLTVCLGLRTTQLLGATVWAAMDKDERNSGGVLCDEEPVALCRRRPSHPDLLQLSRNKSPPTASRTQCISATPVAPRALPLPRRLLQLPPVRANEAGDCVPDRMANEKIRLLSG